MVKICQTGLLKLKFETRPKKRIFRFLPKISAGHGWSWKFFFANFQILGPLGCQGWVVIPQNVKKSQNHCTLLYNPVWSAIKNFAWPAECFQMDTHSNTKILDPGFCFTVNSISGLLRYSNMISETIIPLYVYEEVRKYLDIYEEAVSHIWLCTCYLTRFPLF